MSGNGQLVELLQGSWVAFGRAAQFEGLSRLAVGCKPRSSAGRRASKGCQIVDFWKERRQPKRRGSELHIARCPLVRGSNRIAVQRPWGAWIRLWKEGVSFRLKGGFLDSRIEPHCGSKAMGSLDQIVEGRSEIHIERGIFGFEDRPTCEVHKALGSLDRIVEGGSESLIARWTLELEGLVHT